MIRIQLLRAFVSVMELGTVTGAGDALGLTQPQVSRLVAGLEEELGFALFFRERRRLIPTRRGSRFYVDVKRALNGLDEIGRVAADLRSDSEAVLRILVPPYAAQSLLPPALRRFREDHPERRFRVEIMTRNAMGGWLAFHPFDIGIAALPFELPSVAVRPLADVETVVVLPPGHPLSVHERIEIGQLAGVPFVAMMPNTPMRQAIDDAARAAGARIEVIGETSTSVSACELVAAGIGVTIVDRLVADSFAPGTIVSRSWNPGRTSTYGLIFPSDQPPSGIVEAFAEIVTTIAGGTAT